MTIISRQRSGHPLPYGSGTGRITGFVFLFVFALISIGTAPAYAHNDAVIQVPSTCGDSTFAASGYEFYSNWTIPGAGNVTVTALQMYQNDTTLATTERVAIALYNSSGTRLALGVANGTGSAGWINATITPVPITLGLRYGVGVTGNATAFNIARDAGANCQGNGYPPNGTAQYSCANSGANGLDLLFPPGSTACTKSGSAKYIIPGIIYATNLTWNSSSLSIGSVVQGSSSATNATVTATGNHTGVIITPVAGNGTGFINATPLSIGGLNNTNVRQAKFNCSPGGAQAAGYYEAVFKVNSSNFTTGNNITVGCTVTSGGAGLAWNSSSFSIGSVLQNSSSASNATITATGNHTGVIITPVAGNGTGFITAAPADIGDMADAQIQPVEFSCSPDASQAFGYYEAVFNVNSSNYTTGSNITVGCTVVTSNFTIQVAYNQNDTWFGEVIVNATVTDQAAQPATGAAVSLTVTPPTGRYVYPRTVAMADDGVWPDAVSGDGIYTVRFDVSLNGSAETNGTHTMNVSASKEGFNNASNSSLSFVTYPVRRSFGSNSGTEDTYADYRITDNGDGTWFINATDVSVYSLSTTATNATVKFPILNQPSITGLTVAGSTVNAYRIENGNVIVIYMNLTSATTRLVNLSFNASSDLILTHNDKYQTQTIGERTGKNGFVIFNSHIEKEIFGLGLIAEGTAAASGGLHSIGEDVGMKVANGESGDNQSHTIDCMERVAIAENSSGAMAYSTCVGCDSYYEWNIHWKNAANGSGYEHMGAEILEATPETIRFRMTDHGSTNEWGSTNRYNVTKVLTFYENKRYGKINFTIRNIGATTLNTSLVWGREPWLYSGGAADTGDTGAIPANHSLTYQEDYTWNELGDNWFMAWDRNTYYGVATLFLANTSSAMPSFTYILENASLGTNAGQNIYPIAAPRSNIGNLGSFFFDWRFGPMSPGEERSIEFYTWGGYGSDQDALFDKVIVDAAEIESAPASSALQWNQSAMGIGSVLQGDSNAKNATVTATGDNIGVIVTAVAGNGTAFINAIPADFGDMADAQTEQARFSCSPGSSQAAGYYEAIFKANSSNFTAGDNITVSCTVVPTTLAWNPSVLNIGSVLQNRSNSSNATLTAAGNHTGVIITPVAGNGTGFITAAPVDIGDMADVQTQPVEFNCSPNQSQAAGYYEATFTVNSSNFTTGDDITVGCTVAIHTDTSVIQVLPSCGDAVFAASGYEFYSNWTIPGTGNVTVTGLQMYQNDTTLAKTERVEIALYNSSGTRLALGVANGTGSAGWINATVTPMPITLGQLYMVGVTGNATAFNLARDTGVNCASNGYPPNGTAHYSCAVTGANGLDATFPFGCVRSTSSKYIIPGIIYTTD